MGTVTGLVDGFRSRSGEVGLLDRLDDVRGGLIRSLVAVFVGTVVGFYIVIQEGAFWNDILSAIERQLAAIVNWSIALLDESPTLIYRIELGTIDSGVLSIITAPITPYLNGEPLNYTNPMEPFYITLKLAVFIGIAFALPYLLKQVWSVVAPLMLPDEKKLVAPAIIGSAVLFIVGIVFCYWLVLPVMFRFTMGFQSQSLQEWILVGEYLKIIIRMLVAFGLAFQLPIVILLLTLLGIVTPEFLTSKRRYAVAIIMIVSAFVTPPDLSSMILLMVPAYGLYEVGILLSRAVVASRAVLPGVEA